MTDWTRVPSAVVPGVNIGRTEDRFTGIGVNISSGRSRAAKNTVGAECCHTTLFRCTISVLSVFNVTHGPAALDDM